MHTTDHEELTEKRICADCIGEGYLSDLVANDDIEGQCSYCGDTGSVISLNEMAEYVESAFEEHYSRTATEPNGWQYAMMKDKEIDYDWEREGEPTVYAIMNAAVIPEEAASDIQEILADEHYDFDEAAMGEEGEFSSDTHYEEIMPGDEEWQESWRLFERIIKSEARFFSRTAAGQLSELFDNIDELKTREGHPLVIDVGPDTEHTHFFRARVFQSDDPLEAALMRPDKELSAPPSRFATAGRMNAQGISVFYGATSVETALAEVRPPVGSRVAVARFEIVRPLKLLDLTALSELHEKGSIFDPAYAYRLSRMMFLRRLSSRIARPIMPDDQVSDFLPTQAVADFLATEGKVPLDGILYPSVQVDGAGLNVVLFYKAARCTELSFPKETKLSASTYMSTDDGPEPDFRVTEEVPSEENENSEKDPLDLFLLAHPPGPDFTNYDDRDDSLSVDLQSLQVHIVNSVKFDTSPFGVARHRWTKTDPGF